ncbi:hypothetical protein [Epibacterium ulvae]|uniref:hypothetical protein n=1 Tax=Epibacterium ulvae TaxID=1156985 RepID=UPI0024938860|nr:hypothetical protein [Epibacterium ulvae]
MDPISNKRSSELVLENNITRPPKKSKLSEKTESKQATPNIHSSQPAASETRIFSEAGSSNTAAFLKSSAYKKQKLFEQTKAEVNNPSNNTFPEAWKANSSEIDDNIKKRKKVGQDVISYVKNVARVIADNRDGSELQLDENGKSFKDGGKNRIYYELQEMREVTGDESDFYITESLNEMPPLKNKSEIKSAVIDAELTALQEYYQNLRESNFSENQNPWVPGNCLEMGKVAFAIINKNHPDLKPELIKLNNLNEVGEAVQIPPLQNSITDQPYYLEYGPDHVFVAIGRNSDTDITNPHTWNPDAVIVDAWAGRTYPVTSIEEEMQLLENVSGHQIQMIDYFDEVARNFSSVENKE